MSRLESGGRIDRQTPLPFHFDGKLFQGFAGDTLASALLANDVRLVGRSFKYHRPRGILTAGAEEPNALVTVGEGAGAQPNSRATTIELFGGLVAQSQNRWPSLAFDALSINQWFAPLFVAGFYYKTFMWPAALWERLYEPLIRRAAGLGALSGLPDPDHYDRDHAFCDLLVIGGGPAGLSAALTAARSGLQVILANDDPLLGGRLLAEPFLIDDERADAWLSAAEAELRSAPNVRILSRTTVFGAYDGREYGAVERVSEHLADAGRRPRQRLWKIVARRSILASGAIERPIVFGGNDRPGVMTASAVGAYVHRYGVAPGRRVCVFTAADSGWALADLLLDNGLDVAAVVDSRKAVPPHLTARVRAQAVPMFLDAVVTDAVGAPVRRALVRTRDGLSEAIRCDTIAMAGGWNPAIGLGSHLGDRPLWNETIQGFVLDKTPPGMTVAGAASGAMRLSEALMEGQRAAADAAREFGKTAKIGNLPKTADEAASAAPLWSIGKHKAKAFVDFQHDVTDGDVRLAVREGFVSVEHLKRYTTLGMATDQGKTSQVNAHGLLAEATGKGMAAAGVILSRPPYLPVSIGVLAGHHRDEHFRPERRTASHDWAVENNASFVDVGLWKRAQWYAKPGDADWMATVAREVQATRRAVGVCDVSTLGKIDLHGPDAGALLDRLYTNTMSTLRAGKVRYGLMLREDGFVLDDGTVSRLDSEHWYITTTTANAARVMQHVDFARQMLWPDADVQAVSVTEQWATYSLAGPQSRTLLQRLLPDCDLSDAALPFMGVLQTHWRGFPVRVFRVSFSGEHAYEIAVAANLGDLLIRALIQAGAPLDVTPYGIEALGVMRIEKGHPAGAELNGQTTAADLGLGRMMSKTKDFIGRDLAGRPALIDPDRPALVGLRACRAADRLRGGAHLIPAGAQPVAANDQGHITSAAFSPTLGGWIALGLLRGGVRRTGERIVAHDPVRGPDVLVEVCDPVFVDPEGGRLRG